LEKELALQQLFRIAEAAELLAVKESTIRAWISARRISRVSIGRRAIRIPASEIERIIAEGRCQPNNAKHDIPNDDGPKAVSRKPDPAETVPRPNRRGL
jgi:excisionase family DNA binding protein